MLRHQRINGGKVSVAVGTAGSAIGKDDGAADEKTDVPIALITEMGSQRLQTRSRGRRCTNYRFGGPASLP
jgi:hypothetical protein